MKLFRNLFCIIIALVLNNCSDILDLKPTDKVLPNDLFGSPEGIQVYLANLYYQCPIEDFCFFPTQGFNYHGNNSGENLAMRCDEAISNYNYNVMGSGELSYWAYSYVRDINSLIELIPTLTIKDADKDILNAECHFLRAFVYFEMVKRYGGLPIITATQQYSGDLEALKVPRSTEKATWDFVMSECDSAIAGLPEINSSSNRRANKYTAYALKSRAALFAASVAKYWNKAPLAGIAVDQGLVGMQAPDANGYYIQCIDACEAIMNSSRYSLYMPNPATPADAAKNLQAYFENPNISDKESMLIKGYTAPILGQAHDYEIWYNPNQTSQSWSYPGTLDPTLDLVDVYENYTNPGQDVPIVTSTDANDLTNYNGFDKNKNYYRFDNATDIFANKDARMMSTIIVPGSIWKNTKIIIQAGYVKPDGSATIGTDASTTVNGVTYYTYGAANPTDYSGFSTANYKWTRTGFLFRKFINEAKNVIPSYNQSTIDWAEFRYAEILLNYAEAVVESGATAKYTDAAVAMNATRRRAGHTVNIPLNIQNVMRERRVEMTFENKRVWDLIRRREFHEIFSGTHRHILMPLFDLRVSPPQYIFVRSTKAVETIQIFQPYYYYRSIPGTETNGLIQNPQY